ncbi:hypothetical protein CL617_05330 [archaeon]|nr:hypothetical protein [archaeon]|tara:strand:+ start:486 stop:1385 length:900 start_codon:yes stop_codon:yes gene_type:complete
MISIIITAWEDPQSTRKCIDLFLQENIKEKYEILASCPDSPTKNIIQTFVKKYPKIVSYHKQPRKMPKNELMNILSKKAKGDILIFTDGNKFIEKNAVLEITKPFQDRKVGCVGGQVKSLNPKDNRFGFWSHLLTNAAHRTRLKNYKNNKLIEFTANLLAIRNNIIGNMPLDVAEDAIIPYMFLKKNYKLVYTENAIVKAKYPTNLEDWKKQKVRSIKAHESLNKYFKNEIRMKTFLNEIIEGTYLALNYPKNLKEILWTLLLFPTRLYIWLVALYQIKIKRDHYKASWSRSKSTVPLD